MNSLQCYVACGCISYVLYKMFSALLLYPLRAQQLTMKFVALLIVSVTLAGFFALDEANPMLERRQSTYSSKYEMYLCPHVKRFLHITGLLIWLHGEGQNKYLCHTCQAHDKLILQYSWTAYQLENTKLAYICIFFLINCIRLTRYAVSLNYFTIEHLELYLYKCIYFSVYPIMQIS